VDVRYGLQIDAGFYVAAPVRYGLQIDSSFDVVDGFPPIIDSIYCSEPDGDVLTTLSNSFVIGATNIYDDPRGWTGIVRVDFGYGLNDPAAPNIVPGIAVEGAQETLPIPLIGAEAGDILYFWVEVEDGAGHITRAGIDSIIIEGVPTRYGLQVNVSFSVIEEMVLGIGDEVMMMSPAEFPKRHLKIF